jgi:multidrug efflux pump subunit AcrA (membrane-fusion protein)
MTIRTTIAAALAAVAVAGAGYWAGRRGAERTGTTARSETLYHCPMHPTFVSEKPGECPICGMKLVPEEAAPAPGSRKIAYYRSPMDPSVHSEKPAKDAMGMDFVPVYEDERQAAAMPVPGRATLTLSAERRQILGVRTEPVKRTRLEREIRTVGRVAVDERRLHHVHTKYDGYVEHLHVDFTGKYVRKGEPLLSIYSPDLVATQQEYLLAYRAQKALSGSGATGVAEGGRELLEAARQRLLFWDIRAEDIARLEQTGEVMRTLDLYADISGYVVQKMAFHGMRVTPADTLFDIADLSHLWVLADVYESDLQSVRAGMRGELTVPYLPGRRWGGSVSYVAPTVEEKTRTIKVRLEVDNAGDLLKPDMFADVFLKTDLGVGLVVPESAVIAAGDRKLVFVDRAGGRLEPRAVELGPKLQSGFQVLRGLAEGEAVVTSANFLIDSESSLKAALSGIAATPTPWRP